MRVRKGQPTLVDWMSLADEQADRTSVAVVDADEDRAEPEDPDPLAPSLRTVLAWAIQELAEAQTALRTQCPPPPDPAAGWQRFSESQLEWDAQAAVPMDLLLLAYMRWSAACGEPALPAAVELQRAFRQALHELGWVEGHNLAFESRWSEGDPDRLRELAAELVRLKVDVITATGASAIRAAQQATTTLPIVMLGTTDPVGSGFVASLARPGGNITGVSTLQADLTLKRLELLKEAIPGRSRVAVLGDTSSRGTIRVMVSEQKAQVERALGVQLHLLEVPDPSAPEPAFAAITPARVDALMVLPSQQLGAYAIRIVDLVARHQLPAIYPAREYVEAGGLMAYARDRAEKFQRAAAYVDKILKGAKPADLPVEQPTKFLLVINLKTAQALGLTIPPTLLFQADEVIR